MNQSGLRLLTAGLAALMLSACVLDDDDDNDNNTAALESGLYTMESGGVEREFYLELPAEAAATALARPAADPAQKPLLVAFHGYTGSYTNWVGDDPYYDLAAHVGDEAIFVAPQALLDSSGASVWGGQGDLDFFLDMLAELERLGVQYDPDRVFVAGHSNGAGFTHDLSCYAGDVIRAFATAAGALTDTDCMGSVAALMMQGSNDPLTNGLLARNSLRYWTLYNGWQENAYTESFTGLCRDYSFPDQPANLPWPVVWCEHTQGHDWPDYGSRVTWEFFTSLPEAGPSPDAPPGGGADKARVPSKANLTFQVEVPETINRPLRGAATLRPLSYLDTPTCTAPPVVLNYPFVVEGVLRPGEVSEPITVPIVDYGISAEITYPSEWVLNVAIYVEDGSPSVIPTPGVDHDFVVPITLVSPETDIVIPDVQTLRPLPDSCN